MSISRRIRENNKAEVAVVRNGLYIEENGFKSWYQNGQLHRLNGPAIVSDYRYNGWFQNGLRHRLDGPAREWVHEDNMWYYQDNVVNCSSQKDFERLIKLKILW